MPITTTLNKIRAHRPRANVWEKLLRHLGKTQADDEPLSLTTVLESNGLEDALWCLRACDGVDREARLYAVWCARQVQHLLIDPRPLAALDVAEKYALGEATDDELAAARDAARAAAWAAHAARTASWDAARGAAWDAAVDAAWDAAVATSRDATADAARDAQAAARAAQAVEFRRVFG